MVSIFPFLVSMYSRIFLLCFKKIHVENQMVMGEGGGTMRSFEVRQSCAEIVESRLAKAYQGFGISFFVIRDGKVQSVIGHIVIQEPAPTTSSLICNETSASKSRPKKPTRGQVLAAGILHTVTRNHRNVKHSRTYACQKIGWSPMFTWREVV